MRFACPLRLIAVLTFITLPACFLTAEAQRITLMCKDHVFKNIETFQESYEWSHYFLVEGETKPRKAGYFGQHLRKYVQSDPQAIQYINSYARRQTAKLVTAVSAVGLFTAFTISNLSKESVSREHLDEPDKGRGLLYAAVGTFALNLA